MTPPLPPESVRDLAAGYVLGALSPEETRAFEVELARSPALAREVAELRDTGAAVASGLATRPPADLKDRLMQRVRQGKEATLPHRPRWVLPLTQAALLAASITALVFQRQSAALRDDLLRSRAALDQVEMRLAQRDATLSTLLEAQAELTVVHLTTPGTEAPGIQLFWNRRANQAVLHAFRLPPAPAGRAYQLWLIRDGTPIPSRVFNSGADGQALVTTFDLPADGRFEAAAITQEPAAGSTTPTLPIILVGAIPAA